MKDESPCIFCQITKGLIPCYKVYETENALAFLDIYPSTEGHLMVIHKNHAETIVGYNQKELGELFDTVRIVTSAMERTYNTKILTIGINHGEPMGVHHMHVHIFPRVAGDGGKVIQSLVKGDWSGDLASESKKIADQINSN